MELVDECEWRYPILVFSWLAWSALWWYDIICLCRRFALVAQSRPHLQMAGWVLLDVLNDVKLTSSIHHTRVWLIAALLVHICFSFSPWSSEHIHLFLIVGTCTSASTLFIIRHRLPRLLVLQQGLTLPLTRSTSIFWADDVVHETWCSCRRSHCRLPESLCIQSFIFKVSLLCTEEIMLMLEGVELVCDIRLANVSSQLLDLRICQLIIFHIKIEGHASIDDDVHGVLGLIEWIYSLTFPQKLIGQKLADIRQVLRLDVLLFEICNVLEDGKDAVEVALMPRFRGLMQSCDYSIYEDVRVILKHHHLFFSLWVLRLIVFNIESWRRSGFQSMLQVSFLDLQMFTIGIQHLIRKWLP